MRLPGEVNTLAERMEKAGYVTGGVVANAWLAGSRGFSQGFSEYVEMWRPESRSELAGEAAPAQHRIIRWIDENAGKNKPFFLFVNNNIPHLPYTPAPAAERRFARQLWPKDVVRQLREFKDELGQHTHAITFDDEQFEILRDLYAAEISEADALVGAVVDRLRERGILDRTIFILTADHGENIGEHGLTGHMFSMFDTTMHVPLIIRFPERFMPGRVVTDIISTIHVAPGILDMCSIATPDDDRLDARRGLGRPHWAPPGFALAEGTPPADHLDAIGQERTDLDFSHLTRPVRMYRTESKKVITCAKGDVMLFDLLIDPQERDNLADRQPESRDRMLGNLQHAMEAIEVLEAEPAGAIDDPASLDALKALGYIK